MPSSTLHLDGGGGACATPSAAQITPLVNNGKSAYPPSPPPISICPVITDKTDPKYDSRAAQYVLQDAARKLLGSSHPVHSCMWWMARGADAVEVVYSPSRERARYGNLQTCGSVWACPICSAFVSERRAGELRQALDKHSATGGSAGFATFTSSHAVTDSLESSLAAFLAAFRRLTSKPSYARLRKRWGVLGFVRVLEVTHGRHGWHVHVHVLYFFSGAQDLASLCEFENELFPLWESAASRSQLRMSRRYGLQVKPTYGTVEAYLAKFGNGPRWDVAREMAKGHLKQGRSIAGLRSLSPWELLAAAHAGDVRCGVLFKEYALRFKGRAQLYWSPGLRALLLGDETATCDQAVASTPDDDAQLAGELSTPEWESVKRASARAHLLQLVEADRGGWDSAAAFLALLAQHFPLFIPRPRGALSPEFRAALHQLHLDQKERNRWRGAYIGPLPGSVPLPNECEARSGD